METLLLNQDHFAPFKLFEDQSITNLPVQNEEDRYPYFIENAEPVFFTGRYPFKIRIMILTRYTSSVTSNGDIESAFITYVGYKKENETDYDFDEMIPSHSPEEAKRTHDRACGFFANSSLFTRAFI